MDNLLFAIRRSLSLYFFRRTYSRGVSRTVPLSMLCAHSHSALIRSASAYSSMAFRSFVFFVLLSIWRQRTCLFMRPDIARLTVVPTRHPFCIHDLRLIVNLRIDRCCPRDSGAVTSNIRTLPDTVGTRVWIWGDASFSVHLSTGAYAVDLSKYGLRLTNYLSLYAARQSANDCHTHSSLALYATANGPYTCA